MEIKELGLVLVKAESSYGSDPTPTVAANILPVMADSFSYDLDSTPVERKILDGTWDKEPGFNVLPNVTVKMQYELRGSLASRAAYAQQAVTCNATDNTVVLANHTAQNGDLVMFPTGDGVVAPTGVGLDTWYYVVNAAAGTFKISTSYGGSAVDIESTGTNVTITTLIRDTRAGSSNYPHELDAILKAAGLTPTYTAETVLGNSDGYVTYNPAVALTDLPSVSLWWYSGAKLHKLTGGKCDLSFSGEAGKPGMLEITIRGKYTAVSDSAISLTGATWNSTKPPVFLPATLTIGGVTPVAASLKWSLGNAIAMRPSLVATDGVHGFAITGQDLKGEIDPESVAIATQSVWADLLSATQRSVSCIVGGTAGNKYAFTLNAEYRSAKYADRDKVKIHNLQFACVKSALGASAGSQWALKLY